MISGEARTGSRSLRSSGRNQSSSEMLVTSLVVVNLVGIVVESALILCNKPLVL